MSRIPRAARLLLERDRSGARFGGFDDELRPADLDTAYEIQWAVADLDAAAGDEVVGYKVGATTPVMQAYLGIDHPCGGTMRASAVHQGSARLAAPTHGALGVECEIAVRLGSDLPAREEPYGVEEVASAVATCMAAIEVVEDRYADWRALDAPTLIADNYFHRGAVLGPERRDVAPADLVHVRASMSINGAEVGSGIGRDVLDEPMRALAWQAGQGGWHRRGLRAGEVVLLGSLVQTNWVAAGDRVVVENATLGAVSFDVLAEESRAPGSPPPVVDHATRTDR